MDPHNPAQRKRPAQARQRYQTDSVNARRRRTQQATGGGASARKRDDADNQQTVTAEQPAANGLPLRDRLQSSATATMTAVTERVRRASQFNQAGRKDEDPLDRPTAWIVEPSLYERIHSWLADVMPFSWRERARRYGFWRRRVLPIVAIFACLAVGLAIGVFALKAAGHAAGAFIPNSAPAQATTGGSVMISPLNNVSTTPTPTSPQYDVGVWVSDTLPQGGSVTVYMRVSNNTQAQPGAKVTLSAMTPNGVIKVGPFTTDTYGVASTKLNYGNVGPQKPIFLTATTTMGGQSYSGDYTFVTYG
ncbi:MAG TPA: hypothetical protein VE338_20825 [Ktedonobacterales bacterium]|nr:hypothetical protein [Ktedonobacterales bacterium]